MLKKLDRMYRRKEMLAFLGLKSTQLDELVKLGQFPRPIPLTDNGRTVAWLESDLAEWQAGRIAKRAA
jgi:predicted DNA-binding transcriptional regulator AlpA